MVTETCCLLLDRLGFASMQTYIYSLAGGAFDIFDLRREDAPRIVDLMAKYADPPMDLADASLVLLAEHLGHGRILSTDKRDFGDSIAGSNTGRSRTFLWIPTERCASSGQCEQGSGLPAAVGFFLFQKEAGTGMR